MRISRKGHLILPKGQISLQRNITVEDNITPKAYHCEATSRQRRIAFATEQKHRSSIVILRSLWGPHEILTNGAPTGYCVPLGKRSMRA